MDWFRKEYLYTSDYGDLQKNQAPTVFLALKGGCEIYVTQCIKLQFISCKNLTITSLYFCITFSNRSLKRCFFISHRLGGSSYYPGHFWIGISERRYIEGTSLPAILFSPNYNSIRWISSK